MTAGSSARTTVWWDVALAVVFGALTQVEIWVFRADDLTGGRQVAGAALVALMAVTLAYRSRAPVPAYFVNGIAVGVTSAVVGMPGDIYPFGNLVLLYTMAAVASTGVAVTGLVLGLGGVALYFASLSDRPVFGAFTMVLWSLGWAAGRATLARRTQAAIEHERDLSLAAAQAQEARLALEAQRRRMAREIHDLVGHTLNVMVVHAGAGRRAISAAPDDACAALETIEQVGRTALGELDGLLGMLDADSEDDRAPLPGLDELDRLVEQVGRAGLRVLLERDVDGHVPAAHGATVYRIVQEALTNTLRHADATHVTVEVRRADQDLLVEIVDDGGGSTAPAGRGLRGMAERVVAHGGTLAHGPGVIVDDDALMRAGLRMILEQTDDITVVGEADDGAGALAAVQRARPDVVLMDVRMPEIDGITATGRILALPSPPKVMVLTTFELDDYVFDALAAGASGFLLKRTPPEQLVQSIREVVAGGSMLSPSVTRRVIERFAHQRPRAGTAAWLAELTDRERDVLRAMARGLSNAEIAAEPFIGENTVKTHVGRVFTKLGARDRAQAVVLAFQAGLVE